MLVSNYQVDYYLIIFLSFFLFLFLFLFLKTSISIPPTHVFCYIWLCYVQTVQVIVQGRLGEKISTCSTAASSGSDWVSIAHAVFLHTDGAHHMVHSHKHRVHA